MSSDGLLSVRTFFFFVKISDHRARDCSQISVGPPLRGVWVEEIFLKKIVFFSLQNAFYPPPNQPRVREKFYVWFFNFFALRLHCCRSRYNSRSDRLLTQSVRDFLSLSLSVFPVSFRLMNLSLCELWLCVWVYNHNNNDIIVYSIHFFPLLILRFIKIK